MLDFYRFYRLSLDLVYLLKYSSLNIVASLSLFFEALMDMFSFLVLFLLTGILRKNRVECITLGITMSILTLVKSVVPFSTLTSNCLTILPNQSIWSLIIDFIALQSLILFLFCFHLWLNNIRTRWIGLKYGHK